MKQHEKVPPGFAERMKEARTNAGLSLHGVARATGYHVSYLSRLERGLNLHPSPDFLATYCAHLGVSRAWLLNGVGPAGDPVPIRSFPEFSPVTGELARDMMLSHVLGIFGQTMTSAQLKVVLFRILQVKGLTNAIAEFWMLILAPWIKLQTESEIQESGRPAVDKVSQALTDVTVSDYPESWDELRLRMISATSKRGVRAVLSRWLGVKRQTVNSWVSGRSKPSSDLTLRLLLWVSAVEDEQKKSAASVAAPTTPETQQKPTRERKKPSGPKGKP